MTVGTNPMNEAIACARRGWTVCPVILTRSPNGKKLPSFPFGGWKTTNSSDPEMIRDWFAQRPDASPAILTKLSDLLVVDLDVKGGINGYETWFALLGEHNNGEVPDTFTVVTASGGMHYYFHNTDETIKSSAGSLGPGIDTRGAGDKNGGLVFGPGSHIEGEEGAYRVENDAPVAELPPWLAALLQPVVRTVGAPPSLLDEVSSTGGWTLAQAEAEYARIDARVRAAKYPGNFNNVLAGAALRYGRFVGGGFLSVDDAQARLVALVCERWDRPDESDETTIKRGLTDGAANEPFHVVEKKSTEQPKILFTDSGIAEIAVENVLYGEFTFAHGLGWMFYDGTRWARVDAGIPGERIRKYTAKKLADLALAGMVGSADFKGWTKYNNAGAISAVVQLAASMEGIRKDADDFDASPDVLNTPNGVVDLATGKVLPHDPDQLLTKITSGSYKPGYVHRDWETAISALPEEERRWLQSRVGQGMTGHTTDDGVIPLLYGPNGQNGKGAIMTGGVLPALKDYGAPVSTKLFEGASAHSTEMADLRGQRLMMAEELTGGAVLNTDAIKRISDVESIKARYMRQDNITFSSSHSLFMSSNYRPRVKATDGGTWRRLALVVFPFEFVKPGVPIVAEYQRRGDLGLKPRIKNNTSGQHDAVVTWAVEGAMRWYAWRAESLAASESGEELPVSPLALTARIEADTNEWREENDYIMSFWNSCLIRDAEAAVSSVDLLTHFNRWLTSNGHPGDYSKERFAREFSSHQKTREANATYSRTRNLARITRRPIVAAEEVNNLLWIAEQVRRNREADSLAELGVQPWIWSGFTYKAD